MEYLKVSNNVNVMYPLQNSNLIKSASKTVPTTCIKLPDELIFVDCGSYPDLSSQFRLDMEKKFQRKTTYLLLTHLHWDHFLAMDVFKDVNIVAQELGMPEFNNFLTMINEIEEDKWGSLFLIDDDKVIETIKEAKLSTPNILVKEELRIGLKGNEVIFRVIGGHSIDSAYIYYPKERVLCAGDNLIECFAQLQWESLAIDKVIPGHGNVISKDYLLKIKSYFEDMVSTLKNLISNNIPRGEIFNHPSMPRYFARNQPNWTESSRPDMKWIEMTIKSWYRHLKKM